MILLQGLNAFLEIVDRSGLATKSCLANKRLVAARVGRGVEGIVFLLARPKTLIVRPRKRTANTRCFRQSEQFCSHSSRSESSSQCWRPSAVRRRTEKRFEKELNVKKKRVTYKFGLVLEFFDSFFDLSTRPATAFVAPITSICSASLSTARSIPSLS